MARTSKSADQGKALSRRVLVTIERDMTTKTSRIVWQHEIPVLMAIFGDGAVNEVDPTSLDEGYSGKPDRSMIVHQPQGGQQDQIPRPSACAGLGYVFTGDPDSEYMRLKDVYGTKEDEDTGRPVSVVELAYGRQKDGKLASILGEPTLSDLPDSQLIEIIHGYGQAVPASAKRDDLIKLAEEAGVELV
ncbi:MAG TPA: hypothetical protein VFM48_08265 [Aquabacterium sp.]|nr:hypothetical protein [Aquabacterium sp.]